MIDDACESMCSWPICNRQSFLPQYGRWDIVGSVLRHHMRPEAVDEGEPEVCRVDGGVI